MLKKNLPALLILGLVITFASCRQADQYPPPAATASAPSTDAAATATAPAATATAAATMP